MDKTTKFWNKISAKYDSQVNKQYAKAYTKTIDHSQKYLTSTASCLDFACGTGITTINLAPFVKNITAIDISDAMIGIAKIKAADEGLENIDFRVADIFEKDLKQYDVIMAFNIFYFLDDIPNVLQRIHNLLKDDGLLLSATDCLGESTKIITKIQRLLSKLGLIPPLKMLKTYELIGLLETAGFQILEQENLHDNPPNYFVVARKK